LEWVDWYNNRRLFEAIGVAQHICDNGETVVHAKGCGSQGGNVLAKIPVPPQWVELAFNRDKSIGRTEGYCGNCTAWDPRPRSER
jgi:hypothetical protein